MLYYTIFYYVILLKLPGRSLVARGRDQVCSLCKADPAKRSGVNRGQREHKGSFRGHPQKGGGAVFSWLLSLAVLVLCVISPLKTTLLKYWPLLTPEKHPAWSDLRGRTAAGSRARADTHAQHSCTCRYVYYRSFHMIIQLYIIFARWQNHWKQGEPAWKVSVG